MEVELRARFRFLEKVIGELLLRRRTLYPAELWMHTAYGDCEKYPSIIIREKKGKVNSF